MADIQETSPAARCRHGVPMTFVCSACAGVDGSHAAYTGPYPNRAHRSVAELDALAAAAADHDVLAYLARRMGNAQRVAAATPETDPMHELARDRARQIGVMIDEIRAGLHHGEAAAQALHTGFAAGEREGAGNGC